MIVMDQDDSMVEVSRFYLASASTILWQMRALPHRGYQMLQILNRLARGRGRRAISSGSAPSPRPCRSLALRSRQTAPNPVLSALAIRTEFKAYLEWRSYAENVRQPPR